ncbi:MAG TPA: carbohydrate kinase family protein [Spirochaetaceae bacterium]|jgi:ribokinase|nr:carbohydrate kinase family protein [Spirochaetaceae bacterium]
MSSILVSGLVNLETTLRVEGFPIGYSPVLYPFGGVSSSISGVGMNIALALGALGDRVNFLSLLGTDLAGDGALAAIAAAGIDTAHILRPMPHTPQSVILYDGAGRRQINVDLKDIQDRRYPKGDFLAALKGADAALLCNINFNRDLLPQAKTADVPVFCDVHVLRDPRDEYNRDFMEAAQLLFLSDEGLWAPPMEAAAELLSLYACRIVVIGLGAKGALLCEAGEEPRLVPARDTRPIVSTIGAGDALFSAFTHYYLAGHSPSDALRRATAFASWKIGEAGAAKGFLTKDELERLVCQDHKESEHA